MKGESLDFTFIGHVDSWKKAHVLISELRESGLSDIEIEDLKEVYHYIPSRKMFGLEFKDANSGKVLKGMYVETFIPPGKGIRASIKSNIEKIRKAIVVADSYGSGITTLGGFSSILIEGRTNDVECSTALTTGNTLTSALIVKGIEQLCTRIHRDLSQQSLLIIGATGDLGIAVSRYMSKKAAKISIAARNSKRLLELKSELSDGYSQVTISDNIEKDVKNHDIIICVASVESPTWITSSCKRDAIICDGGYPKNMVNKDSNTRWIYSGGMGLASGGNVFKPEGMRKMYRYPHKYIVHGCLLEAIVLAFAKRFEPYSIGRGNITIERIETIWELAQNYGIEIAPYYNENGIIEFE